MEGTGLYVVASVLAQVRAASLHEAGDEQACKDKEPEYQHKRHAAVLRIPKHTPRGSCRSS
jgi:hypothetical protein